ncbi:PqqD family peptide modification chaperone [Pseudoclostridium thermosuccinogenes]|uniref:PqqD family peptide modification chaperone n=1 Tax=Clostridium thermosuccinogenes TaxID=84032 RepID=UPI002FDA98AB
MIDLKEKFFFDREAFESMEIDGDYILYSDKYKRWFKVTNTAKDILEKMDGQRTVGKIAEEIAHEYEMPANVVIENVIDFCKLVKKIELAHSEKNKAKPVKIDTYIRNLYIDVTNACNFSCEFCNKCVVKENENPNHISKEELEKFIDKLIAENRLSYTVVHITGGEPLMHPEIFDILAMIKGKGLYSVMWTNGFFVSEENINLIKKYCSGVILPLDSVDKEKNDSCRGEGAYEAFKKAKDLCERNEVIFYVSSTPTNKNINHLNEITSFAYDINASGHIINEPIYIRENGDRLDNFFNHDEAINHNIEKKMYAYSGIRQTWRNNLTKMDNSKVVFGVIPDRFRCINTPYTIKPKESCGAGINELYISPNGVYPCHMLNFSEFKLGNLNEELEEFRKVLTTSLEECKKCVVRMICLGGCRAKAYYDSNDIAGLNVRCKYDKKLFIDIMTMYNNNVQSFYEDKEAK